MRAPEVGKQVPEAAASRRVDKRVADTTVDKRVAGTTAVDKRVSRTGVLGGKGATFPKSLLCPTR